MKVNEVTRAGRSYLVAAIGAPSVHVAINSITASSSSLHKLPLDLSLQDGLVIQFFPLNIGLVLLYTMKSSYLEVHFPKVIGQSFKNLDLG